MSPVKDWVYGFGVWPTAALCGNLFLILVVTPWLIGVRHGPAGRKLPNVVFRVLINAAVYLGLVLLFFLVLVCLRLLALSSSYLSVVFLAMSAPCLILLWVGAHVLQKSPLRTGQLAEPIFLLFIAVFLLFVALVGSIFRSEQLAMRKVDASNLRNIGCLLKDYHEKNGEYPDDLRRLYDDSSCSGLLISACTGTREPDTITHPYDGSVDFRYIHLPKDRPSDLVWVWAKSEWYDWEEAIILYSDGEVRRVKPGQILSDLERTYQWLLGNQRSAASHSVVPSMPATP